MINADASHAEIEAYFNKDTFATEAAGCRIVDAAPGSAVCEMELKPVHYNAMQNVMGGAIFTLADFALAVACNIGEHPTVSVTSTIEYLSTSKGTKLIAKAHVDRSGRTLGFYTVDVFDDAGVHIARVMSTCKRFPPK